jgi:hypothetical protein
VKTKTVAIRYTTIWGKTHEHSFTGTPAEIDAEIERMRGLADVADAWSEG